MFRRTFRQLQSSPAGAWTALIVALGTTVGCGGNSTGSQPDPVTADTSATGDGASGGGDGIAGGGADIGPAVNLTESFWIAYQRRERQADPGTTPYSDLVLTARQNPGLTSNISTFGIGANPLDPAKPALEFTKIAFAAQGLSCAYGCLISSDLQYAAIATGSATATGYTYQLGLFTADLVLKGADKFGKLENVADIHFAGGDLFYSTRVGCTNGDSVCQYAIHRRYLNTVSPTGDQDVVLVAKMAPDDDPDTLKDTTYSGHFQVSDDGKTLVFLTPTIRSVRVYAWRDGNLSQLDYICEHPNGDQCTGTGSQYHDTDKVAVSPDGKTVVLFTIVDRFLRVRKYTIGSEVTAAFTNLVEVPAGNYLEQVCSVLKTHPGQHAEVRGQPYFSADGQFVFHLGYSKCSASTTDKEWTDIMALPVASIGAPLHPGDWLNLTNNPRDNSTANKKIFSFSMSPQRQAFLISATATVDQNGSPIKDGQTRALKDSELYVLPVGASEWQAVTNELLYDALLPQAIVQVPAP